MQDGSPTTNKEKSKFGIIIRVVSLILILLAIVLMITGCISNKTDTTDTDPVPLEPVEQTEPTETGNLTSDPMCDKKPIIYLYPEELMGVNVILGKPENIICSYPQYYDGWSVMAYPNGDLVDEKTGRELYSLYYECIGTHSFELARTGFVVAKEDTISFLEEKLEILGLTEHEAEEFIIYWLPRLMQNEYNYIRFASQDEIEEIMPLTIVPAPDTTIRVLMYFTGLDSEIEISEQKLTPVTREGFTVVEWGGAELDGIIPWRLRMPCSGIKVPRIRLPKLGGNN